MPRTKVTDPAKIEESKARRREKNRQYAQNRYKSGKTTLQCVRCPPRYGLLNNKTVFKNKKAFERHRKRCDQIANNLKRFADLRIDVIQPSDLTEEEDRHYREYRFLNFDKKEYYIWALKEAKGKPGPQKKEVKWSAVNVTPEKKTQLEPQNKVEKLADITNIVDKQQTKVVAPIRKYSAVDILRYRSWLFGRHGNNGLSKENDNEQEWATFWEVTGK